MFLVALIGVWLLLWVWGGVGVYWGVGLFVVLLFLCILKGGDKLFGVV